MPLIKVEQINEDTRILIWHLTEDDSFFENHLSELYDSPLPWNKMNEKRKKEFLGTRYLIQLGLPPGAVVCDMNKDENGCPRLNDPSLFFGISHTSNYISCVISKSRAGCDIERYQERILNLTQRFMTQKEIEWATGKELLAKSHLIWGIKESAFKTWGRKQIDWKKNIQIDPFKWNSSKGSFSGFIGNHTGSIAFHGGYEYFSDCLFVWSIEL